MKAVVENVSIARNGQVVLRINSLDYWSNEGYLHSLLASKGLPADIFLLEGCELEFTKVSHKAGDAVINSSTGKPTGATYKKDGQRMEKPALLTLGSQAQQFRTVKIKEQAKLSLKGAGASISFKKSERSAVADNQTTITQEEQVEEPVNAGPADEEI